MKKKIMLSTMEYNAKNTFNTHKKKNEHIYRMQEKIANMWIAIVKPLL